MFSGIISKYVGIRHEVVYNRDLLVVSIMEKKKQIGVYHFDKMYRAVNFYASLKQVKDIKNREALALKFRCQ